MGTQSIMNSTCTVTLGITPQGIQRLSASKPQSQKTPSRIHQVCLVHRDSRALHPNPFSARRESTESVEKSGWAHNPYNQFGGKCGDKDETKVVKRNTLTKVPPSLFPLSTKAHRTAPHRTAPSRGSVSGERLRITGTCALAPTIPPPTSSVQRFRAA